jgi:hypothetical protein
MHNPRHMALYIDSMGGDFVPAYAHAGGFEVAGVGVGLAGGGVLGWRKKEGCEGKTHLKPDEVRT